MMSLLITTSAWAASYPVVDTGQTGCYDNRQKITCPTAGLPFSGQDAQQQGNQPSYRDNDDGTITDLATGLTWAKARGEKIAWNAAVAAAAKSKLGGYSDWRVPTIKELYSLINFNGGFNPKGNSVPYLDTHFFEFKYGVQSKGERGIDCQDWSATEYLGTTMNGNATVFGVNFADGRIKGYPKRHPRKGELKLYVRYVRGNPNYGKNNLHENGNGTVSDRATGLVWAQADSGQGLNWQQALAWVQTKNAENYLGYHDWRLPNAKELQSIIDYSRAPQANNTSRRGPAIDPVFSITSLTDGEYPFFWTSTTHLDGPVHLQGSAAIYLAFGRATGWMTSRPGMGGSGQRGPRLQNDSGSRRLLDVHGAGAQRSDPKVGNPDDYPQGRGPQGDVIRIYNFVRLARGAD
jgi:hypothetical protein